LLTTTTSSTASRPRPARPKHISSARSSPTGCPIWAIPLADDRPTAGPAFALTGREVLRPPGPSRRTAAAHGGRFFSGSARNLRSV